MQVKQEDREAVSQWLADECGTPITRDEIASLHEAFAAHRIAAREAEPAAVVAYLRGETGVGWDYDCEIAANLIEAGEHLTAE